MTFFIYCVLIFTLAASLGVIIRCFVSVSREPSIPKLSAITAAVLVCLLIMLISHKNSGIAGSQFLFSFPF